MRYSLGSTLLFSLIMPATVLAQSTSAVQSLPEVQVTATRIPERVDRVPASVTVVKGEELRARGATDLQGALALVAGVEAPAGGDAGPASAVPSLWGLHEFDAFLLVVDGVPWGGAFNPSIPTLDFNDVERIEVLRGAAPVIYGATAFVGVIQVIHYPAGKAAQQAEVSYGSYGTVTSSASLTLPQLSAYRESLAISGKRDQLSDPRAGVNNVQLLYRGASPLAGGQLRLDLDTTIQRQAPTSPAVRDGNQLVTPVDANFNPADGRIDEHRYHFVLGYSHETPLGDWETTLSYAHSNIVDIRGFLRTPDAWAPNPGNTDSQNQDRGLIDSYLDTHFSQELFDHQVDVVYGADLLYGSGKQYSFNGEYCVYTPASPACPVIPPATMPPADPPGGTTLDEINGLNDRRAFMGQYLQLDWKPDERWDLMAGLRLNETRERNTETHVDTADSTADTYAYGSVNRTKPSGMIGASYLIFGNAGNEAVAYADYRNTFKPAAIDFGPDVPTPTVLAPETARSYEAGLKGYAFDHRLDFDTSLFFLHFNNLVVADGNGGLTNAGSELLSGVELESRYHLGRDWQLALNYSYHLARYGAYVNGDNEQLDGKHLELSPHVLAAAGLRYLPASGFFATAVVNAIGSRYLDEANSASTPGYQTVDASFGYRLRRMSVGLQGFNLTDERKPVTASEFGDSSYYLLPARRILLSLGMSF